MGFEKFLLKTETSKGKMGNIPRRFIFLLFVSIIAISGTISCSEGVVTVVPTSVPLEINGEQVTLRSVSLVVIEPGDFQESDLIKETTQRILARLGIEILESGSSDGTLTITQDGYKIDYSYIEEETGWHTTLEGGETDIEVTLSSPSHGTITGQDSSSWSPGIHVSSDNMQYLEPSELIIRSLIGALTDIWSDYLPIAALKDSDEYVRICATWELETLYTENKMMTPAPESATSLLDVAAYGALTALGSRADGLIPTLVEFITTDNTPDTDSFDSKQSKAANLLVNIGPASVPALLQLLENPSANIRKFAAEGLGTIETQRQDVIDALAAALRDEDTLVVEYATKSLLEKEPEIVLPTLTEILIDKNENSQIRYNAGMTLSLWKDKPEQLLPVLLDIVNNKQGNDEITEQCVLWQLPPLGTNAYDVTLPIIIKILESKNESSRFQAAYALEDIGLPAMQAVPSLINAIKEEMFEPAKSFFANALKAITGEDYGINAEEWQQWWQQR
jgi:HEAT repeat protein